ncbi:MAG: phosphoglucosamine mutase [Candidatus Pacebacteria bacterium]|nr:phosphoglucosamine mutase [Candidatus Paceibacterota bacterium]MBP9715872.1 phosphoglucosamine mutase [Candidatus Paceibacterota bacterium]
MANTPKLAVSGYRGIWGDTLTIDIAKKYAQSFGLFIKESNPRPGLGWTVLIGRDGRESGPAIRDAIIPVLESMGINVIDGDVLPTPTVLLAVRENKYDGAIIITASHNPIEYNGLKFITASGFFTDENQVEKIKKYFDVSEREYIVPGSLAQAVEASRAKIQQDFMRADGNNISSELIKMHSDKILSHIDVELIKSKKFKVAVDMTNGAASVMDPYLFEQLGIQLIPINNVADGKFTHKPEPLKQNLGEIETLVKNSGADIGFAQDPDADRLVVINEKGEMISEEYTIALAVEAVLSVGDHSGDTVVVNMSTSQMNADIAEKYGVKCIRSKVGEANVVGEMIKNNSIIGGEGGGGAIYPTMNFARDSFSTLALILELLAKRNLKVSELVDTLPTYFMKKDKVDVSGSLSEMYSKLKAHFSEAQINELDGLRLDFADRSWIHLRPSNTEPIVRLYGEATTQEKIEELFNETKALF